MVPLWSGVHVYGFSEAQLDTAFSTIRGRYNLHRLPSDVARIRKEIIELISAGNIHTCYERIAHYPPDIRTQVEADFNTSGFVGLIARYPHSGQCFFVIYSISSSIAFAGNAGTRSG